VRCLSIHADYACRDSGACCTAGWRIPIDEPLRSALLAARTEGRFRAPGRLLPILETSPCEFHDAGAHRCVIHAELGAEFKPASCRHFPRVALLDQRGVSMTLSHFCPTAASMLFRHDVPLAVVEGPQAFPPTDDYEGLDARSVLPPLLRPGMLWDLEGYSAWEERAVSFLGTTSLSPEGALEELAQLASRIEAWKPGGSSLRAHVNGVFADARREESTADPAPSLDDADTVVKRYLAARLFGSWVPYRVDRLSALVEHLQQTLLVLKEEASRADLLEAIRATDLRTVHGGER
jgi:hypothetical protein